MSNNYFKSRTGKVVTQWPSGNMVYRVLTKLLGGVSETTRRLPVPGSAGHDDVALTRSVVGGATR